MDNSCYVDDHWEEIEPLAALCERIYVASGFRSTTEEAFNELVDDLEKCIQAFKDNRR